MRFSRKRTAARVYRRDDVFRASWIPKSTRKEHETALVLYERRDDNAVTTPAPGGKRIRKTRRLYPKPNENARELAQKYKTNTAGGAGTRGKCAENMPENGRVVS